MDIHVYVCTRMYSIMFEFVLHLYRKASMHVMYVCVSMFECMRPYTALYD